MRAYMRGEEWVEFRYCGFEYFCIQAIFRHIHNKLRIHTLLKPQPRGPLTRPETTAVHASSHLVRTWKIKKKRMESSKKPKESCWTSTAFEISKSRSWTLDMLPYAENELAKNGYKLLS